MNSKVMEGFLYSKDHVWVKPEGSTVHLGISDYARQELDEIIYVDLPKVGQWYQIGETLCEIESVKTTSKVICPIEGTVGSVNLSLADSPEKLNDDPYGAFLVEMNAIKHEELDNLMDAGAYTSYLESL